MITQRAWLVGVVGFCFYLIAIVNTLPAFYQALTWLSFGVLGSSLGIAFLSLIGLRAAWRVPHAIVTEGVGQSEDGPIVEVQMSNVGTLNKTGVLIEVQLERISSAATPASNPRPNSRLTRRFLMEALPSGSSLQTSLPLLHLPRGRYRVIQLKLIGSDTLGLFRVQKRVPPDVSFASVLDTTKTKQGTPAAVEATEKPAGSELVIGPAALAHHDIAISPVLSARGDGGVPAMRFLGQGEDVRGTRLYAAGDDLRNVHWKSTARKGQLVVKEFHHTVQEQVLVIWDGAFQTRWGESREDQIEAGESIWRDAASESGFNSEEWSLRLTASLCRALLESRRPCALLRLDAAPHGAGIGTATPYSALTMEQVSQTLADARADREINLYEALQPFRASRSTSEVYFVTASLSPEVARAVSRWRSEGARVVVTLVNGAAFLRPAENDRHSSPHRSTPVGRMQQKLAFQNWIADEDNTVHQAAVTKENYTKQASSLRAAGAHVVMVSPRDGSRDFLSPIHSALQELFDKSAGMENIYSMPDQSLSDQFSPVAPSLSP